MTRNLVLSLLLVTACATSGSPADDVADAQSDATSPGSVELWQASDAQWRFHVESGNGRTLLTSEGYTSRTSALSGLISVLGNGVDPLQYQVHLTDAGKYNLHLLARNYEVVATTETYASKSNATRAIDACVRAITSYLDKLEAPATGTRVEFVDGAGGLVHFNVFAGNGEIVLTSQRYRSRAAAWNGAFASQDAVAAEGAFGLQISDDGRHYFTLSAANHEIVGVSQMYTTRASAEAGIASVTNVLPTIELL